MVTGYTHYVNVDPCHWFTCPQNRISLRISIAAQLLKFNAIMYKDVKTSDGFDLGDEQPSKRTGRYTYSIGTKVCNSV